MVFVSGFALNPRLKFFLDRNSLSFSRFLTLVMKDLRRGILWLRHFLLHAHHNDKCERVFSHYGHHNDNCERVFSGFTISFSTPVMMANANWSYWSSSPFPAPRPSRTAWPSGLGAVGHHQALDVTFGRRRRMGIVANSAPA